MKNASRKTAELPDPFARDDQVCLRDYHPAFFETFLGWWSGGEWLHFDSPREGALEPMTAARRRKLQEHFLKQCAQAVEPCRQRALIGTPEGRAIGWVIRYSNKPFPTNWFVGIDICDDEFLNRGLGTQALQLWIDHLFENSDIHKVSLNTWCFNPRMMRVAEKLGFALEGRERDLIRWRGEWRTRSLYGMLRAEWRAQRSTR